MAKKFVYRGMEEEQLKALSLNDFMKVVTSRERRALKRGFTESEKKLLEKIKKRPDKYIKTHERNIVVIPQMLGSRLGIFNGKEWVSVDITADKLGHRLGEFAMTRRRIKHSSPGIGASRSSKHVSIK
jgi:small subunit ribosomal protein S19